MLVAAAAIWLTGSAWPDIIVATLLTAILLRSAARVLRGSRPEWRGPAEAVPASKSSC